MHELELVHQVLGHGNGAPVLSAALERRNPQLRGLEVDVAGAKRERLAHAAAGHCERAGERLNGGLAVGPDRGEETYALLGHEVLPPARVDELAGAVRGTHRSGFSSAAMTSSAA